MKLTRNQCDALFSLMEDDLKSVKHKTIRERKKQNKQAEEEAIKKFKLTKEYKAAMLLAKTFKGSSIDFSKKIDYLAYWMFKPERKIEYFSVWDERKTIELLAIDCRNLAQLKEKLNTHYSLKKKLK